MIRSRADLLYSFARSLNRPEAYISDSQQMLEEALDALEEYFASSDDAGDQDIAHQIRRILKEAASDEPA